jgi:hypothetical protein
MNLYAIDNWHQLPNARSNADPNLRIVVTDFVNSDVIQGVRIQVRHPVYGVLFAAVVGTSGRLVSYSPESEMSTSSILAAIKHFGFDVSFKTNVALNIATREFLQGALAVGYTHVRRGTQVYTESGHFYSRPTVFCFNESVRPDYVNQVIEPLLKFHDVMLVPNDGKGADFTLDFSWLDFPMHIRSVLES